MSYTEQCNKYFAPIDEISEALSNSEGVCGVTNIELRHMVENNIELAQDIKTYG